jgi:hypothetical protein
VFPPTASHICPMAVPSCRMSTREQTWSCTVPDISSRYQTGSGSVAGGRRRSGRGGGEGLWGTCNDSEGERQTVWCRPCRRRDGMRAAFVASVHRFYPCKTRQWARVLGLRRRTSPSWPDTAQKIHLPHHSLLSLHLQVGSSPAVSRAARLAPLSRPFHRPELADDHFSESQRARWCFIPRGTFVQLGALRVPTIR